MANRFNEILPGQDYVSSYVPLPLDLLLKSGAMKQEQLDSAKKAIETSADPFAKLDLGASVKYYDRQGNIVDSGDVGLNSVKNNMMHSFTKEREQLSEDLVSGKITDSQFKDKSRQHIRSATNAYNQLAAQENVIKQVNKANEEIAKNTAFATSPYYGTELLEYNTKWLNNAKKGVIEPYSPPAIAKEFNIQKALMDFKFKDEGNESVNIGDYISKYGTKGVTQDRVKYAASQVFNSPLSEIHQYSNLNTLNTLRSYGLTGKETVYPDGKKVTMLIPDGLDKNKKPKFREIETTLYNKLMQEQAEGFINGAIAEHAGIETSQDVKANQWAIRAANKKDSQDLLWGLASVQGENVENYKTPNEINSFIDESTGRIDLNKKVLNINDSFKVSKDKSASGAVPLDLDMNKNVSNESKSKALDWIENQALKLNIKKSKGESENDFANRVLQENKQRQQNVIINRSLAPVSKKMDELLIGKDGSKLGATYDDFILEGTSESLPFSEFVKKSNIDLSTVSHNSVSFDKDAPGSVLFTAKDNNGSPVKFYGKSRDINFSNSTQAVNFLTKIFKGYYSSNKIEQKRTIDNKTYTIIRPDKSKDNIYEDDRIKVYAAIDENNDPITVTEDKSTGKAYEKDIEKLKSDALGNYFNSSFGTIFSIQPDKQNYQFED